MDEPQRSTWTGFSPRVVIGVLAVLVAGGVTAKAQSHGYADDIATICAASLEWKHEMNAPSRVATRPSENSIFHALSTNGEIRLRALERLNPEGDDAAIHRQVVTGERELVARATAAQAQFSSYLDANDHRGASAAGFMGVFKSVYPLATTQDALYEREFGIAHCAD